MMFGFSQLPMLRLVATFCVSIITAIFLPLNFNLSLALFIFSALALAVFTYSQWVYKKYKLRWVYGLFFTATIFSFSQMHVYLFTASNHPDHFLKHKSDKSIYLVRLNESCHQKINSYRVSGDVKAVIDGKKIVQTSGEVLIYLTNVSEDSLPRYGDYIFVSAKPQEILPPQNPSQFNYKRYLSFHNIYSRFTLNATNFKNTNKNYSYSLYTISFYLRDRLIDKLKQFFITRDELAVASALLVGFEDYLDPEIIQAFSSTGALHVLSVSGMHVGLVFIFLSRLLFFMDKRKFTLSLKFIVLLAFIWFYALITGFSPSILRSVLMVSLVIFAKMKKKDSEMLNTMLASAFILLCINPYYITEVGFQLSYLAVFGIVYLHPLLVQKYMAPNKVVHWIWELTSVSLTAQLMTFPLGLLYFHQFPLLFLISNLIIIPISTLIIYFGIGALIVFFIEPLANFLWTASYYLTYLLNLVVKFIDSLKSLNLQGISITILETWIIYLLIASLVTFLVYRQRNFLFGSLALCLILIVTQIAEKYNLMYQQKIIVYSIPRTTAIDLINGNAHSFISTEKFISNANQKRFFVLHNWDDLGLQEPIFYNVEKKRTAKSENNFFMQQNQFVLFGKKIIYIADSYLPEKKSTIVKTKVDFAILTNQYNGKVKNLLNFLKPNTVIIDSSVPFYKAKKYKEELKWLNVNVTDVTETGALIVDL
jgi:competence protein ComEC